MDEALKVGDVVIVPWGLAEVRGTVVELYGSAPRAHVVVELTPAISGDVVDERTTVSLPIDSVHRAVAA